jgi:hypothetical protein
MFPVWWHIRTEIRYTNQSEAKPRWMIARGCVEEMEELPKINIIVTKVGGSEW